MFGLLHRLRHGCERVFATREWVEHAGGPSWHRTIFDIVIPDRFFAKQGRSIARWTLSHSPNLVAFVKRHYQLPRWRGLLTAVLPNLRLSPGWGEFHHLETARSLGVPAPRVLAAAEFLRPGGRLQSVLAVEELTGMLPLHEAIPLAAERLPPRAFARWKRGLIVELVRLSRLLHDQHWFHKDLYLCHFFIPEATTWSPPSSWQGTVVMIDFHRLARHPLTSRWWQAKDLGQLLYSTADVAGVTDRDRLRFWREYRRGRSTPRWLAPLARVRAQNHLRHNLRRPQAPPRAA